MEKSKSTNYGIQAVRCTACIMILLHHLSAAFNAGFVDTLGRCAVSLFIVISGFLTGMYKEPSEFADADITAGGKNVLKKVQKFYWIYFLSFFVGCAALYIRPDIRGEGNFAIQCIMFLLMLQSWFPDEGIYFAINPVCWYMSIVVFFAFSEPFILRLISKMNVKIKILSVCIVYGGLIFLTILSSNSSYCGWFLYIFPLIRLGDFYCALIAGNVYSNCKEEIKISKVVASFLEITAIVMLILGLFINVPIEWQYNVLYLPISIILVFIFAMQKGNLSKVSDNSFILKFADISYIIFIIHQLTYMVVHMLNKYILHLPTIIICIIAVLAVIILAVLLDKIYSIFANKMRKIN